MDCATKNKNLRNEKMTCSPMDCATKNKNLETKR